MKIHRLFLIIVSLLFLSCEKEEVNQLFLTIKPSDTQIIKSPKEIINFSIEVKSNENLKFLMITSREANSLSIDTLKIIYLSGTNYNTPFLYQLPELVEDTTLVYLNFYAQQENGKSLTVSKRILNVKQIKNLTEKTGNLFYTSKEKLNQPNSYNLKDGSAKYTTISTSTDLYIADDTTKTSGDELSMAWISIAGGKFRKDNGFDYVNATNTSLKNAFESGQQLDKASLLKTGDIILFKITESSVPKYYVIKLTAVIDLEGTENDRYEFNYKN